MNHAKIGVSIILAFILGYTCAKGRVAWTGDNSENTALRSDKTKLVKQADSREAALKNANDKIESLEAALKAANDKAENLEVEHKKAIDMIASQGKLSCTPNPRAERDRTGSVFNEKLEHVAQKMCFAFYTAFKSKAEEECSSPWSMNKSEELHTPTEEEKKVCVIDAITHPEDQ